MSIDPEALRRIVRSALEEDVGAGDMTSLAVVPESARARGSIVARQPLVVAGLAVAREVFRQVDETVVFGASCADGQALQTGGLLASVEGAARPILAAERTALNFLRRVWGSGTGTWRYVEMAEGSGGEIADTRKTAPGLRPLDKYAVRVAGGANHRAGLYDAVLIKDNHWRLSGGITEALRRARRAPEASSRSAGPIAIEVSTLPEVDEALRAGAEALLLDNMEPRTLEQAVERARGRAFLEVSGGVNEGDVPRLAALRVNRISIGSLTHSVQASDIALELLPA